MRKADDHDHGWAISARLRGDRQVHFRGLSALQALATYRHLGGRTPLPPSLLPDLAKVSGMLLMLNRAEVEEVTIEGPQGEKLLNLPLGLAGR